MPVPPALADTVPRLSRGAAAWRTRSHRDLAALAADCRRALGAAAEALVAASRVSKGWLDVAASAAEEWISGPLPVARFLFLVQRLHERLASGRLPAPRLVRRSADEAVWSALPAPGLCDRLLLAGCSAQVHTAPDAGPIAPPRHGDVALVLGAGNVTATPLLDVLHHVFLAGRAALLKCSPLHRDLVPHFAAALAPLVAADLLDIRCGDAGLGRELADLPGLGTVHVTGSTATWGAVRAHAAATGRSATAETGCCTPVFVVPGRFGDDDLRAIARQLAIHVACNGGATCLAPRLVLTARAWPQREAMLAHLRDALAALPARVPFHPAARTDFAAAAGRAADAAALQPTLRAGLDPTPHAPLWSREHFAPVLLELPLSGDSAAAWAAGAAAFVREHVFGSLAAYVFAPRDGAAVTAVVADLVRALPHGSIAIDCWAGLGYGLGVVPWGVAEGRPWQHGAGWSRGTVCLPGVRRCVVRAPLRPRPAPPWQREPANALALARALFAWHHAPSARHLLATIHHAL